MNLQDLISRLSSNTANDNETGLGGIDTVSQADIVDWLVLQLADQVGLEPSDIDIQKPCSEYGLDSIAGVSIAGDLEVWLDLQLSPTLLWDYPSITQVSQYLMTALEDGVIEFGLGHVADPIEVSDGALVLGLAPRASVDATATVALMAGKTEPDFSSSALDSEVAARLLAQLDTLSDAEVDTLLNELLAA
jgi:acyl carrier protein